MVWGRALAQQANQKKDENTQRRACPYLILHYSSFVPQMKCSALFSGFFFRKGHLFFFEGKNKFISQT
jgi:hypothetical protein